MLVSYSWWWWWWLSRRPFILIARRARVCAYGKTLTSRDRSRDACPLLRQAVDGGISTISSDQALSSPCLILVTDRHTSVNAGALPANYGVAPLYKVKSAATCLGSRLLPKSKLAAGTQAYGLADRR